MPRIGGFGYSSISSSNESLSGESRQDLKSEGKNIISDVENEISQLETAMYETLCLTSDNEEFLSKRNELNNNVLTLRNDAQCDILLLKHLLDDNRADVSEIRNKIDEVSNYSDKIDDLINEINDLNLLI